MTSIVCVMLQPQKKSIVILLPPPQAEDSGIL
jgi:hypothetical protein